MGAIRRSAADNRARVDHMIAFIGELGSQWLRIEETGGFFVAQAEG